MTAQSRSMRIRHTLVTQNCSAVWNAGACSYRQSVAAVTLAMGATDVLAAPDVLEEMSAEHPRNQAVG